MQPSGTVNEPPTSRAVIPPHQQRCILNGQLEEHEFHSIILHGHNGFLRNIAGELLPSVNRFILPLLWSLLYIQAEVSHGQSNLSLSKSAWAFGSTVSGDIGDSVLSIFNYLCVNLIRKRC